MSGVGVANPLWDKRGKQLKGGRFGSLLPTSSKQQIVFCMLFVLHALKRISNAQISITDAPARGPIPPTFGFAYEQHVFH